MFKLSIRQDKRVEFPEWTGEHLAEMYELALLLNQAAEAQNYKLDPIYDDGILILLDAFNGDIRNASLFNEMKFAMAGITVSLAKHTGQPGPVGRIARLLSSMAARLFRVLAGKETSG